MHGKIENMGKVVTRIKLHVASVQLWKYTLVCLVAKNNDAKSERVVVFP